MPSPLHCLAFGCRGDRTAGRPNSLGAFFSLGPPFMAGPPCASSALSLPRAICENEDRQRPALGAVEMGEAPGTKAQCGPPCF